MTASLMLNVWASLGSILIAVAVGLYVHYSKHPLLNDIKIPPWEYSVITLLLVFAINPAVTTVGYKMAVTHQTTFNEFLSGVELQPTSVTCHCHESEEEGGSTGGCTHYYDVDSYTVQVWVPEVSHMEPNADGKGSHKVVDTPGHYEPRTKWRQRPYTTTETTWIIPSTVGDYDVGQSWLPENPEAHRLMPTWGQDSNDALDTSLPSGTPAAWTAANNRVLAGKPGPVTKEGTYLNYILPSVNTRLRQYSSDIARYQKAGLLPELGHDVYGYYYVDGAYFEGVNVANKADWQYKLAKLNALLGSNLQGRLYVVVVDANKVSEHETTDYIAAVTAYWQSPKFAKDAVSKNAIIVALGSKDGTHVDWADASTGMPRGNEAMLYDLSHNLAGAALDPTALFGDLTLATGPGAKGGYSVSATNNDGAIGKILFGPDKFQRVSMSMYTYLKGDVVLSGGEVTLILIVDFIFSLLAWAGIALWGIPALQDWQASRSSGRRYR